MCSSLGDDHMARVDPTGAGMPCAEIAAATIRLLRISPAAAIASIQRGVTSRSDAERAHEPLEFVELLLMNRSTSARSGLVTDDPGHLEMTRAQRLQRGDRLGAVARAGIRRGAQELDPSPRQAPTPRRRARASPGSPAAARSAWRAADDGDQALDGGRIGHRRPAELHDNHGVDLQVLGFEVHDVLRFRLHARRPRSGACVAAARRRPTATDRRP